MNIRLWKQQLRMWNNRRKGQVHRVLFLDFDGVVNVPYQYGTPEYEDAMNRGVYDFFRPEIVQRLNHLIHAYDLHVVISSSWRYSGMEFCQNSLWNAGFDQDVVIEGVTPMPDDLQPRSEEIFAYLEAHPDISAVLILDDIPMHALKMYAVETVFEEGYTEACDRKARAILDRQIGKTTGKQRFSGGL